MSDRPPVVELEGVTVAYGAQRALQDVTARFAAGAVGLLGPNGAGKSTMIKALLGFVVPSAGKMRVLGYDVAMSPLHIRARRLYAGERCAHPRDERSVVRRLLRRVGRPAPRRRDAAGPRSAVLRWPRGGPLSQRRDLFHRNEAAHQAGASAGARSRSPVSRRTDQRD